MEIIIGYLCIYLIIGIVFFLFGEFRLNWAHEAYPDKMYMVKRLFGCITIWPLVLFLWCLNEIIERREKRQKNKKE